jgi:uncharacterized membrane protein YccC
MQPTQWRRVSSAALHGVSLAIACAISFSLATRLLSGWIVVSPDEDLLGGMWAVIATTFVYRLSYEKSAAAAVTWITSTSVSFVLCLIYLLLFPFHLRGLAALIGFGAVVMSMICRPDDIAPTGITTAVIMVVAAIDPRHAWMKPVLRMVDTLIGVAVGIVAAWISLRACTSSPPAHRLNPPGTVADRAS